ncbi:MAG: sigma-54 dependent transcriptional regulator [Acidobacteriota bacterium]
MTTTKDILIVDDEPQMLIAMHETLKREWPSIETAGSGLEASEKLQRTQFRLVITDLRMPGISGTDLLRDIKCATPRTQVVLVTAHGTVNNAVEAMKLGAFDYLLKPFSSSELRAVVERAIQKNQSFINVRKTGESFPILTQDPDMLALLELAEQAARTRSTVLIQAESGTGKELLARWIHQCSPRNNGPFVAVNCAALPDNLLEAELFGHEKGAFTGAIAQKRGKFEVASGGSILLDEIGEMVPLLQAKLLRVLQEQEIDRVGGKDPIPINVRVIATTNRDLKTLVKDGTFREDLYYRLNVIPLSIPPLRKRPQDVSLLATFFCEKYSQEQSGKKRELAPETLDVLTGQDWKGNVRELENVIQRATALAANSTIYPQDLLLPATSLSVQSQKANPPAALEPQETSEDGLWAGGGGLEVKPGMTVGEVEKRLIHLTLEETGGNRTRAAKLLGISLRTLRNKLREYRMSGETFMESKL